MKQKYFNITLLLCICYLFINFKCYNKVVESPTINQFLTLEYLPALPYAICDYLVSSSDTTLNKNNFETYLKSQEGLYPYLKSDLEEFNYFFVQDSINHIITLLVTNEAETKKIAEVNSEKCKNIAKRLSHQRKTKTLCFSKGFPLKDSISFAIKKEVKNLIHSFHLSLVEDKNAFYVAKEDEKPRYSLLQAYFYNGNWGFNVVEAEHNIKNLETLSKKLEEYFIKNKTNEKYGIDEIIVPVKYLEKDQVVAL